MPLWEFLVGKMTVLTGSDFLIFYRRVFKVLDKIIRNFSMIFSKVQINRAPIADFVLK